MPIKIIDSSRGGLYNRWTFEVTRMARASDRRESPAEHTWAALILADFLLGRVKGPVDRHGVFELYDAFIEYLRKNDYVDEG
jgi:hypothetical protein